MKRIRVRVIMFAGWLVIFCNLDQLLEPVIVSRFPYAIALGMVMTALVLPHAARISVWAILAAPIPMLLLYNAWTGALTESYSIPRIFMEVCIIDVTILLAYWVNMAIREFENSVAHITVGRNDRLPEPDSAGQGLIYREVRRARNHQRPLTLMTVAVEEKSIQGALDRMVQEAQLAMIKQYTLVNVSKTLCDKLADCDIIVQSKDHFLIVLPETKPEHIPGLVERLREQVSEQVGVSLKIGTASLPADGFTLEGLIDKATNEMQEDLGMYRAIEIERLAVRHNIS